MGTLRWIVAAGALAIVGAPAPAWSGTFDAQGNYLGDPAAVASVTFGPEFDPETDRYFPADTDPACKLEPAPFQIVEAADALEGGHYLHLNLDQQKLFELGCVERFRVAVPVGQSAYVARVWLRHGSIDAAFSVVYPEESGLATMGAKLGPTGRVTSDGWVELASNPLPIDGSADPTAYLRIYDFDSVGSDIDAIEVIESGDYWESQSCEGFADPACGPGAICAHNRCRLGRVVYPAVPEEPLRAELVDRMQSQLRVFFGGRKTRLVDLPNALATLDAIRDEDDPFLFWNGWATAIRQLHDWHTSVELGVQLQSRTRLNACFIVGDADLSHDAWPSDPEHPDVLVSHVGGSNTWGLEPGDRLVAVDGQHPIAWAKGLIGVDAGWWIACDDAVVSELLERMRGLIIAYATSFTVLHCDAATQSCDPTPETLLVADLPDAEGGNVGCDNRPFYHVAPNPGPGHHVGYDFYQGLVAESDPQEAIYSLVWDTLYGGGDPNGWVNGNIKSAYTFFKQNARGVVLDHRAGSGGTLDGSETMTELVRPPEPVLVFASPARLGAWDGPETQEEGIALFERFANSSSMIAGSNGWDPDMPVALLLHRDGSASDFGPAGMKGAPKTRIFGPSPTAGAFSTYYNHQYWSGISVQLASGDSVTADGNTLIGHGVVPDEIVVQKQSDLLAGLDTIHEAALAWLRTELKP
jgi:hypothetical protein